MNKTDKKIEEILDMYIHPKANKAELMDKINTEVQKAVEEAVRGFGEWIFQCPLHPDAEDDWVSDYLQTLKDKQ